MWKKQLFWSKKNSWEKYQIDIEMKNYKPISQKPIFFEYNKTLKTNKIDLFAQKHFWKLVLNTKETLEFLLLKT